MSSPLLLAVDDEVGVRESLKMVFSKEYRLLEAASAVGICRLSNATACVSSAVFLPLRLIRENPTVVILLFQLDGGGFVHNYRASRVPL